MSDITKRTNADTNGIDTSGLTIGSVFARCVLYTLLFCAVGLLPLLDLSMNPFDREILFTEYSFVQLGQLIALAVGTFSAAFLLSRGVTPELTSLFVVLLTCALVREADSFLDKLADGLWQTLILLILVGEFLHLKSRRQELYAQIAWLTRHFSFGLMLSGFVVIMGFARFFGQGALWQQIMGEHYTKTIKYFAEESVEMMGYALLTIGVIEFSVAAWRQFCPDRVGGRLVDRPSHR